MVSGMELIERLVTWLVLSAVWTAVSDALKAGKWTYWGAILLMGLILFLTP